jgi:hypothetical protein
MKKRLRRLPRLEAEIMRKKQCEDGLKSYYRSILERKHIMEIEVELLDINTKNHERHNENNKRFNHN